MNLTAEDGHVRADRVQELFKERGSLTRCSLATGIKMGKLETLKFGVAYGTGSRGVTLRTIRRLADYFDVSIDWLCGRSDVKEVQK